MPNPITAAAAAFAKWATAMAIKYAGVTSLAGAQTVYAVAYGAAFLGGNALVSMGLSALAQSQMPDPEAGKIPRKQPRPVRSYAVGGESRMSGPYMLREANNGKLGLVIALNDGRLDNIGRYYLNDDRVTLIGGYVQGLPPEKYGGGDLVRIDHRLGLATETAYSFLTTVFPTEWPSTRRGDGIASLGILAQHRSRESFPRHYPNGEILPSVAATPVCYDWRDPAQDREDETTWGPCWNPVVWLVHVEWFRHGRSWARCIEPVLDDLTDEADYCDELVAKAGGGTEARYRLAGNFPVNTTPEAVRSFILSTFDGWLSIDGRGRMVVKAGRYVEPTFTLTAEHIEGYSWRAFQADEECCNQLLVSYVSADQDFSQVDAGIWEDLDDQSARGRVWSEDLALTGVPSASQAMRLAGKKGRRINAERRGFVRSGIYGLNGLGQRFIRVQNPEMSSMADVVVEVVNVEIDFEQAQVTFEVIKADTTPDDDEVAPDVDTPDPVTPTTPTTPTTDPAVRPIIRDEVYPTTATEDTVTILSFGATLPDGKAVSITGDTITGLAPSTTYGVFWREDAGIEVEAFPALSHMTTGSWVFLGWQSTHDGSDVYPTETAPGGFGGSGEAADFTPPLGDLALLDSLSWSDVVSRPTELTDGRISTALNSSGVLQTNIPSSLANSSNLLRYSGGGNYTGDLNATLGAAWGSNLTGRPTELTDGRIATALNSSGVLQTNIPSGLANGSNLLRRTGGGLFTGSLAATDDTTVNTLAADLLSGAVVPATAGGITDQGALATQDSVSVGDQTAYTESPAYLAAIFAAEAVIQTITVYADGVSSIRLDFSCIAACLDTELFYVDAEIRRGGVLVRPKRTVIQSAMVNTSDYGFYQPVSLQIVDTPPTAGFHTYEVVFIRQGGSGTRNFFSRLICAHQIGVEVKRYIITDASDLILRSGYATDPLEQIGSDGTAAYEVTGADGGLIDDMTFKVDSGAFVRIDGAPGDVPVGTLVEL